MSQQTQNGNDPQTPDSTSSEPSHNEPQQGSEETGQQSQTNNQPDGSGTVAAPQPMFSDPDLARMTPQQVEEYVRVLRAANEEQKELLNQQAAMAQRTGHQTVPQQQSAPQPDEPVDFWQDPNKALASFEQKIRRSMEEMIQPFRQDLTVSKAQSARQSLRQQYDDFTRYEPLIDNMLRQQGVNPDTAERPLLETIYLAAVGAAMKKGLVQQPQQMQQPTQPTQPLQGQAPMNIPQHRPSSAPLPPSQPQQPQRRQLTESEKHLARIQFPNSQDPEGEYLKYQEMDAGDVVNPGFSKENW